jgi:hypothetical protein
MEYLPGFRLSWFAVLVCLRVFTIPSVSHRDLVRLIRTFLQVPLEASGASGYERCLGIIV